ncbi:hypothetical protein B0H67DRAFT_581153 [Lasiosphaeris hirsuta]|uniref:Uncharacterized protein n=1 Tax=Lasiosphaeris hirsuta TaxID=260670 RepID=A0AA40AGZ6_9PEZI|nr:hypothetical protein B0H67DRAFT_581153 [Lasiosphaeris hirsuta]
MQTIAHLRPTCRDAATHDDLWVQSPAAHPHPHRRGCPSCSQSPEPLSHARVQTA